MLSQTILTRTSPFDVFRPGAVLSSSNDDFHITNPIDKKSIDMFLDEDPLACMNFLAWSILMGQHFSVGQ
jgi:hypothetical protein